MKQAPPSHPLQFDSFLNIWKSILEARKTSVGLTYFDGYGFDIKYGKKYAKICAREMTGGKFTGQLCVSAFVNLVTGEIFKPASWNAPAKHSRGNFYAPDNGRSAIDAGGFIKITRRTGGA